MEWLLDLLGVEAPPGTELESWDIGFRNQFFLVAVIVTALLTVGIFVLYWRESSRVNIVMRFLMALVRISLVVVLLLLLMRPVVDLVYKGKSPRTVALLIDNTKSMDQRDRRTSTADRERVAALFPKEPEKNPTRAELVVAAFNDPKLNLLPRLSEKGPLQPFLFGREVQSVSRKDLDQGDAPARAKIVLKDFKHDQLETALADAIYNLLQRPASELPTAIVVVTDGLDNASQKFDRDSLVGVAAKCKERGVPLLVYGVGSSEGRFLRLKDVRVSDTLFREDTITVPVRFSAVGFKTGTVEISLTLGDEKVKLVGGKDSVDVSLLPEDKKDKEGAGAGGIYEQELTFVLPRRAGATDKITVEKMNLVANIHLRGSNEFKDSLTRPVRVVDNKIRVLYVENAPRWEYKFLQNSLKRDRRVIAKFLLIGGEAKDIKSTNMLSQFPTAKELYDDYDLIILGDVPASFLGKNQDLIRDFVEKHRGGLIMMAGTQNMPASYTDKESPIADLLPVEFVPVSYKGDQARPTAFRLQLNEKSKHDLMLQLGDTTENSLKIWNELEGIYWYYPITKLKKGAKVLLEHPRDKLGADPMPLVVLQRFGKGEVLWVGIEETWRWRFNEEDKYFGRFWAQVVSHMGLPHLQGTESQRVQVGLEGGEALLGRPSMLYARLFQEAGKEFIRPEVNAKLVQHEADGRSKTRQVKLKPSEAEPGRYELPLPNDRVGRFELKVDEPEAASYFFEVNLRKGHELEESNMAEEQLRALAKGSGGAFYQELSLNDLPAKVVPRYTEYRRRAEVVLWNWLTFVLFVVLITVEWLLRKFASLA
jgi:uncharacterized membrane protein